MIGLRAAAALAMALAGTPLAWSAILPDGGVTIEMDVDVQHGATTEALDNQLVRWISVMKEFLAYIR